MKGGKLTRKQKMLADYLLEYPQQSATEAATRVLNVSNRRSASVAAADILKKPHVQAYMEQHSAIASDTMFEIMDLSKKYAKEGGKEGASYAGVAVTVAKDILDRVHGKPTQKIEQTTQAISINIDLTGNFDGEEGNNS